LLGFKLEDTHRAEDDGVMALAVAVKQVQMAPPGAAYSVDFDAWDDGSGIADPKKRPDPPAWAFRAWNGEVAPPVELTPEQEYRRRDAENIARRLRLAEARIADQ
jgi:hypothetical protein